MATDAEIKERRRRTAALIFQGLPKTDVFEKVAEKYDCSPVTVKNDWFNRKKWMREVWDLEDEQAIINDIIAETKWIKERYYQIYENTEHGNNKLGALKGIRQCNKDLIEILQDMGILTKEPNKVELTGKDGGPLEITAVAQMADEWEDVEEIEATE